VVQGGEARLRVMKTEKLLQSVSSELKASLRPRSRALEQDPQSSRYSRDDMERHRERGADRTRVALDGGASRAAGSDQGMSVAAQATLGASLVPPGEESALDENAMRPTRGSRNR